MVKRFLLLLPVVLLFARCDTPAGPTEVNLGEFFNLSIGQTAVVRGEKLNLEFIKVVEDSRCPVDVECVTAGNARIIIGMSRGGESGSIELNTPAEPRSNSLFGYSVRLVDLKPYQRSTQPIPPDQYVATLVVTKQ